MSLFASSFESGVTAGPSSAILPPGGGNKSNKRKRPSLNASEGNKEEQLRATQKNLERLMSRVEKGDVKPKEKKTHQTMNFPKLSDKQLKKALSANRPQAPPPAQTKKQKQVAQVKPHPAVEKEKEKKAKQHKATPAKVELDPEEVEGLTDLQKGMKSKLEGARFRWINEQLYSTPSTEAVAMMKKDPKIFADYHMTHRVLTSAWPSPPLPYIVDLISPLPAGTIVVDLGCGDAGLAKALTPEGKIVLSYDLVGDSGVTGSEDSAKKSEGWVVEADFLEKVPLPGRPGGNGQSADHAAEPSKKKSKKGKEKAKSSEVVDVVVCCLSLMGVNWVGGIYEACRVLKAGGTLHVAEVTSRFISTEKFTEKVESFGFKLENEESPSTHFTLFRFTKTADVPIGPVRGQSGWNERVQEGEEILRGCVYKKR